MDMTHCHLSVVALCLTLVTSVPGAGVDVVIATGTWEPLVPLRQELFSVAVGLQVAGLEEEGPAARASLSQCLAEMASPILRLPGGDSMNRWNWDTGSLAGEGTPGLDVHWWQALARPGRSTPMWGINVSTAAPEVTGRFARTLKENGYSGAYFELGNELYYPRWGGDVMDYIAKAKAHAAALRKHFPQCKLGVPLASYQHLTQRDAGRFALRDRRELSPWIEVLAQQDFYDAVVLHLYTAPWDLGSLETYTKQQVAQWGWTKADPAVLDALCALVQQTAPGKRIWVTEWAFNATQYLQDSKGYPAERRWQVHQTMLAVLHDARFLLNAAVGRNAIDVMTTWTLVDQPAVALWKRQSGPTIRYELFRMLRRAREGNDGICRLASTDAPMWHGPAGTAFAHLKSPAVDLFAFYRAQERTAVLVLNALSSPVTISAALIPRLAEAQSLTGADILPGWGRADNPLPKDWGPKYRGEKLTATRAGITVPPHSVTLITLPERT